MASEKNDHLQEAEQMTLKDQVSKAIHLCMTSQHGCRYCPYDKDDHGNRRERTDCIKLLLNDFDFLMTDMENVIKLLEAENERESGE